MNVQGPTQPAQLLVRQDMQGMGRAAGRVVSDLALVRVVKRLANPWTNGRNSHKKVDLHQHYSSIDGGD